jgi:hypothetical protein
MKNLLIASITVLLFGMMGTSCKKTVTNTVTIKDTVAPTPTIVGFWAGYYDLDSTSIAASPFGWAMQFNVNGTMRIWSADTTINVTDTALLTSYSDAAPGTYTIVGDSVKVNFTYGGVDAYYSSFAYNPQYTYLNGGFTSYGYGGGLGYLVKQ